MKPILNNSNPNRMELGALFLQPTRWCSLSCKGCYVKEHQGGEDDPHLSSRIWEVLFKQFYTGPHWANQITIAVDDLPRMEALYSAAGPTLSKRGAFMGDIIYHILANLRSNHQDEHPEVHMTFHTPYTLIAYEGQGVYGWEKLSMVSFSEMPLTEKSKVVYDSFRTHNVPINFNYMVPQKWDTDLEVKKLLSIAATYASHIYLVMFKTPIGRDDPFKVPKGIEVWKNYKLYFEQVVDKLPDSVKSIITPDGCFSDTIKYSRTGFGCSSNISRFQVWPDGSVSGCPYAHSSNTKGGEDVTTILENIREAKKQYDFSSRCHLPMVNASLAGRQGLRVIQV